jgi:2-succinyl-6-hydroxy-2,4-cyclohexadiene-1-carboxylate synthase
VGGAAVYIGYSMGGRMALRLALDRPALVRGLVLIGASPGIDAPAARAQRRTEDEARATHLEQVGVEAFVDEWLRGALFASLPADRACRDERCTNTVDGLAASLRQAGTGAQEPLWSRLHELQVPVLLLVGERDTKFRAIAAQMAPRIGAMATVATVPGAGHCAHLEDPTRAGALVRAWLDDLSLA